MNFLAHFALSNHDPDLILGNFLGDFLRAGGEVDWPEAVQMGIRFHRQIDRFTDTHAILRNLRRTFPAPQRRFSAIILDVVFDHYLLQQWKSFYPNLDRRTFIRWCYDCLQESQARFPPKARNFLEFMVSTDLLNRYAHLEEVALSLGQMSYRVKQPNGLENTFAVLNNLDGKLGRGFQQFYPGLMAFCEEYTQCSHSVKPEL